MTRNVKKAYRDDAIEKSIMFELFSRFKRGKMSIGDKSHSSRLSTTRTVEIIREIILELDEKHFIFKCGRFS